MMMGFLIILYSIGWVVSYLAWVYIGNVKYDRDSLFMILSMWILVVPCAILYIIADILADKLLERKKKS